MKLLILLSRVPYPTEKGDKLRAFHQIRCLSEKHEIILCALSEGPVDPEAVVRLKQYCSELHIFPIHKTGMLWNVLKAFFSGKPIQTGYFYRCKVRRKIQAVAKSSCPDHVYCQLLRMAEYAVRLPLPRTIDYQDVFSMGVKRRLDTSSWWKKPFFRLEYKRLLRYENRIFEHFNHHSIISVPDRDLIPHPQNKQIAVIPNGVDHAYFIPLDRPKKYDIVFTGNMGYPPNIDAALFLSEEIFPLVLKEIPSARLLIAGATPHPRVRSLQSERITVSGWVPDIRESYASSRIFIAPMRIGTGLQNKLLEAMAMGIPCVTSPLANNALEAVPGTEILIGNTAEEFAGHMVSLLKNPERANDLALSGTQFVRRKYDWHASTALLEQLFFDNAGTTSNTN